LRAHCFQRGIYRLGLVELKGFHRVTSVTKSQT
jgi:hypothetical protein